MASNTFTIGTISFEALGDRVLIEEDAFRSGYECGTCGGSGKVACSECFEGTNKRGHKCSHCNGMGANTCPTCGGKGGLLIAPEVTQRRPTTGTVVSAGPKVSLAVGDRVMFSNFAGYVVDLTRATGESVNLRILHEPEILCRVEGHLELRTLKGKSEIATFQG